MTMLKQKSNPNYSNVEHSTKVINDIETGQTKLISFDDEAWEKISSGKADLAAIQRRAKYLFSKGLNIVTFDAKEIEKLSKKSAFGKLSKYANPALIPFEEGAWERAVIKKYGKGAD